MMSDTVHAEAAREMVLRHDWVALYTNGIRYLEKAPLMYWAVARSYKLFGIGDWSTRLPLMLGVLALLLTTYALGKARLWRNWRILLRSDTRYLRRSIHLPEV